MDDINKGVESKDINFIIAETTITVPVGIKQSNILTDNAASNAQNRGTSTHFSTKRVSHGNLNMGIKSWNEGETKHDHNQQTLHSSVTINATSKRSSEPKYPSEDDFAVCAENWKEQTSDYERNEEDASPHPSNQHANQVNDNASSSFDRVSEPKSRSERIFNCHLGGRSLHRLGGGASRSTVMSIGQDENSLFAKLFVRSTRTRTVTTLRRSVLVLGGLLGESGSRSQRIGWVSTSVIVDRRNASSSLVHRVTAEALPQSTLNNATGIGSSSTEVVSHHRTHESESDLVEPRLAIKNRADSLQKERRGRSLFRTKDHKRSRARSPGPRQVGRNGNVVGTGTGTGETRMGLSKMSWVRRESPSPQPAMRKRSWVRKVIPRAERERRAAVKESKGAGTGPSTAIKDEDSEVTRKC